MEYHVSIIYRSRRFGCHSVTSEILALEHGLVEISCEPQMEATYVTLKFLVHATKSKKKQVKPILIITLTQHVQGIIIQHVVNIKITVYCVLHLQHISIRTRDISGPVVAVLTAFLENTLLLGNGPLRFPS